MINRISWRALTLLLALSPAVFSQIVLQDIPPLPSAQEKALATPGSEKLDPRLRRLMQNTGDSVETAAKGIGVLASEGLVSVELTGDPEALQAAVTEGGGEIQTTYNGVVYARVPPSTLSTLGNRKELEYAGPQPEYHLLYQAGLKVSEGVDTSAATALHRRGITGRGVKVGIIDGGFFGYAKLQSAGILAAPKNAVAINPKQSLENDTEHGTACAEIIHQMAPDADLYLAAVELSTGPILKAVQWMLAQHVDIINFSVGANYRGDGRDDLSLIVEESTRAAGMLWLVAAGNEGDAHWMGSSTRVHASGFLQTASAGGNAIRITAHAPVTDILLRWDDWGENASKPSATQDLDLYVLRQGAEGKWDIFQKSDDPQNGNAAPLEHVRFESQSGQEYLVLIKPARVNRNVKVHLFASGLHTGPDPTVVPDVAAGSIGSPALTRAAVAVGAVDVREGHLAAYSSQGPTDDGRVKPDIAAPAGTTSGAYALRQQGRFHGTSAAAPHATGFAALIRQISPQGRADSLRAQLIRYVRPMGSAAPNNEYGFGHIDGSRIPGSGSGPGSGPAPTGSRRTIRLPKGFGGDISLASIERYLDAAPAGNLDVKVVVGRPEYRVGEGMKIGFRASEDCYYVLLNRDSSGSLSVVAPLEGEADRLAGGERYALPRGQETIKVTGPGGREEVILICSKRPVNLNDANVSDLSISIARYEVKP